LQCCICTEVPQIAITMKCSNAHNYCLECWIKLINKSLITISQGSNNPRVELNQTRCFDSPPILNYQLACTLCKEIVLVYSKKHTNPLDILGIANPNREYRKLQELLIKFTEDKTKCDSNSNLKDVLCNPDFEFECPFASLFCEKKPPVVITTEESKLDAQEYDTKTKSEMQSPLPNQYLETRQVQNLCKIKGAFPTSSVKLTELVQAHLPTCMGLIRCSYCDRIVHVSTLKSHLRKHERLVQFAQELYDLSTIVDHDLIGNPLIANLDVCSQLLNIVKVMVLKNQVGNPQVMDAKLQSCLDDITNSLKAWPQVQTIADLLNLSKLSELESAVSKERYLKAVQDFIASSIPLFTHPERFAVPISKLTTTVVTSTESLASDNVEVYFPEKDDEGPYFQPSIANSDIVTFNDEDDHEDDFEETLVAHINFD
jgi:hypothetical protein